ncbi:hypothetical protein QE152_g6421 [Popillia japonica]|uniref:Endonuclease-reverse transcriptase n=1 Tax=Popillia japonica TaxID=7064 RepID=A0AAW1MGZ4_POPJA
MQAKYLRLAEAAQQVGLRKNTKKTKLLIPHENDEDHIEIDWKRIEVKEFCYLGSTLERQGEESIETTITRRKWKWIGHTFRKPNNNITRQALSYSIAGERRIGRPRNTWRRTTEDELGQLGTTWKETRSVARDRTKWRDMVERLCEKLKVQEYRSVARDRTKWRDMVERLCEKLKVQE